MFFHPLLGRHRINLIPLLLLTRCFHNMTQFRNLIIFDTKLIWLIHNRKFIIRCWWSLTHTQRQTNSFTKEVIDIIWWSIYSHSIARRLSIYRSFNFLTCCSNCCKSLPAAATLHKYSESIRVEYSTIGSSLIPLTTEESPVFCFPSPSHHSEIIQPLSSSKSKSICACQNCALQIRMMNKNWETFQRVSPMSCVEKMVKSAAVKRMKG